MYGEDPGWGKFLLVIALLGAVVGVIATKGCEYVSDRINVEWHEPAPQPKE